MDQNNQEHAQNKDNSHFKRKKKLILPRLQLSLVMAALVVFILTSVVFFATVQIVFLRLQQLGLEAGLVQGSQFFTDLSNLENLTAVIYGATILVSILAIFWGGIRLSHKVAGPIFYLNRHIIQVCNGETNKNISFRKGDYIADLEQSFNMLMERYRKLEKDSKK